MKKWQKQQTLRKFDLEIKDMLLPLIPLMTSSGRQAFVLDMAFDLKIQCHISFDGSTDQFVSSLLQTINKYTTLEDGRNSRTVILETVKKRFGLEIQAECNRLISQIQECLQCSENLPDEPFQWDYSKLPLDFTEKIDFLTQYFVGRQEAIERIEQFLQTQPSGYLAIVGEAGIGKSALLAHEIKKRGALHHFVDDKQNNAKYEVFVRCIVEQLRQKYGFEFDERQPLHVIEWEGYLRQWMKDVSAEEKLIVFVDALDEAQHCDGYDSLLKYLSQELSGNVYFILSSRPEFKKETITLSASTIFECYELPPLRQIDIVEYLHIRHFQGNDVIENLAAVLFEKSEGNPLYFYYFLQEWNGERLTLEESKHLPQGLMKFYEKQWRERIWIGENIVKERRKEILRLLFLLKEPPDEEMLLVLTDFDRAELQDYLTPLRRFMRPGEQFEFFHKSFNDFIEYQFGKSIPFYHEQLIKQLLENAVLHPYALRWLPTHFFETKHYDKLFDLAHDPMFLKEQEVRFPDKPENVLLTLSLALQGAIEQNDAARIAEFSIKHARIIADLHIENPLTALRAFNLSRAWKVADLDGADVVEWYLLLAWELYEEERQEDARATLDRLQQKTLLPCNSCDVIFLLTMLYPFDPERVTDMAFWLPECEHLSTGELLCESFAAQGTLDIPEIVLERIQQSGGEKKIARNIAGLLKLAEAQTRAGKNEQARRTLQTAVNLAQKIQHDYDREPELRKIGEAHIESGDIAGMRKLEELLSADNDNSQFRSSIIMTLVENGEFAAAWAVFDKIPEEKRIMWSDEYIARRQAETESLATIFTTINQLPTDAVRRLMLRNLARFSFPPDDLNTVKNLASQINDYETRMWALTLITRTIAKSGNLAEALITAQSIKDFGIKAFALHDLIKTQLDSDDLFGALNVMQQLRALYDNISTSSIDNLASRRVIAMTSESLKLIACKQMQDENRIDARTNFIAAIKIKQQNITDKDEITRRFNASCTLSPIISAQAETGDLPGATRSIQYISNPIDRSVALSSIVSFYIKRENLSAAQSLIAQITDEEARDESFQDIAKAQVLSGDTSGAFDTVRCIISDRIRAGALDTIGTIQLKCGDILGALHNLEEFWQVGKWWRSNAFIKDIVTAQIQTDDFAGALKTAYRFAASWDRNSLLREIATAQVRAKDISSIITLSNELRSWLAENPDDSQCYGDWETIVNAMATAQAQAGERTDAVKTIQQLGNNKEYALGLTDIAKSLAQNGDGRGARTTWMERLLLEQIEQINYSLVTGMGAEEVKQAIQGNNLTISERISNKIDDYRTRTLSQIALIQIEQHQNADAKKTFEAAIAIARDISDDKRQAWSLETISVAQARSGDMVSAQATVRQIRDETEREKTVQRISALSQGITSESDERQVAPLSETEYSIARSGDIAATLAYVEQFQDGDQRAKMLARIAAEQSRNGFRDAAQQLFATAAAIKHQNDSHSWNFSWKELIAMQIAAGFCDDALHSVELIQIDRDWRLPDIAALFLEYGQPEYFKKLLLSCASYLYAAYSICGHLARLYPEQAAAIADVLLQQERIDNISVG